MKTKNLVFIMVMFSLIFSGLSQAQEPESICANGLFALEDQSVVELNSDELCAAAQPFFDRGLNVYVFVTDADPATQDEWYALLDTIEAETWHIYDRSAQTFESEAVTIEFSTQVNNPHAATISVGDMLGYTPLYDRANRYALADQLMLTLAENSPTVTLVQILNQAVVIAGFGVQAPVVSQDSHLTTPLPTLESKDTTTQQQHETGAIGNSLVKTTQDRSTFNPMNALALLGVLLVIVVVVLVLVSLIKFVYQWLRFRKHMARILTWSQVVFPVIDDLVGEDDYTEGTLYQLLQFYGLNLYPDLQSLVQQQFELASEYLSQLRKLLVELEMVSQPWSVAKTKKLVARVESFLSEVILIESTHVDLGRALGLIHPASYDFDHNWEDIATLTMVARKLDQLQLTSPRFNLVSKVQKHETDDSLFELIAALFMKAREMADAQHKAEEIVQKTQAVMAELENGEWAEPGLTMAQILAPTQQLLQAAQAEAEHKRFLTQQELSEKALETIQLTQELLVKYRHDQATTLKEIKAAVASILGQGFTLPSVDTLLATAQQSAEKVLGNIAQGNPAAGFEALQTAQDHFQLALNKACEIQDVALDVENRLRDLSTNVEKAQKLADGRSREALVKLLTYPQSNWGGVEKNLELANTTLQRLFDNPHNAKDLASQIQDWVATKVEAEVLRAEVALSEAEAALLEAEAQLSAITTQTALVEKLEAEVNDQLQSAGKLLDKAVQRRNADNVKISPQVDDLLNQTDQTLTQAGIKIHAREFTQAAELLSQVEKQARSAYQQADEQALEIDRLTQELAAVKKSVAESMTELKSKLSSTFGTILSSSTQRAAHAAIEAAQQAGVKEVTIQGLEDHALRQCLEKNLQLYRQAEREIKDAAGAVAEEQADYDELYSSVKDALVSAEAAINNAESAVNSFDAQGYGRMSLTTARSLLSSIPSYGVSQRELQNTLIDAQEAERKAKSAESEADARASTVRSQRMTQNLISSSSGSFTGHKSSGSSFGSSTNSFGASRSGGSLGGHRSGSSHTMGSTGGRR